MPGCRVKFGAAEAFHCKQQILHNKRRARGGFMMESFVILSDCQHYAHAHMIDSYQILDSKMLIITAKLVET